MFPLRLWEREAADFSRQKGEGDRARASPSPSAASRSVLLPMREGYESGNHSHFWNIWYDNVAPQYGALY
jgi:hypothetical protein